MKNRSYNPPAFPRLGSDFTEKDGPNLGMSLRDYFAAKAVQAMLSNPSAQNTGNKSAPVAYAEAAYTIADAMLVEREKDRD